MHGKSGENPKTKISLPFSSSMEIRVLLLLFFIIILVFLFKLGRPVVYALTFYGGLQLLNASQKW